MKQILKKIIETILKLEAKLALIVHRPFIIAVVGNIGKTSTKDTIYELLKSHGLHVRASYKSFNSEIGVPLTVIGLKNAWSDPFLWLKNILNGFAVLFKKFPKYLILEIGADAKGDIRKISRWIGVDILVLTSIPEIPVHVGNFKNKEELINEKLEILNSLKKDSVVIYDIDSKVLKERLADIKHQTKSYGTQKELTPDYLCEEVGYMCKSGKADAVEFSLVLNGVRKSIEFDKNLGWHQAYFILPALALADFLNLDLQKSIEYLSEKSRTKGRMSKISGINSSVIIDDTYNSSPEAVLAGIKTLAEYKCINGKKIAVLGDMLELGKLSSKAHREVINGALEVVDGLYLCGNRFCEASKEFESDKIKIYKQDEKSELINALKKQISTNDLVYIKGSQGMRMEKIVKGIMDNPELSKDLLVRQEKEWTRR